MGKRIKPGLHEPPEELRVAESMAPKERCDWRNRHYKEAPYTWSRERVRKISKHPVSTVFRDRVSKAIQKGYALDMVYRDWEGRKTIRRIHPKTWVKEDRFTAFCELRHDNRDFRVHRMADCRVVVQLSGEIVESSAS